MALLTYVNPIEFDSTELEFTIDNAFLKMGGLDRDDLALYESIISGTEIGFFQENREMAFVRATENYTSNGIELESEPILSVGEAYHIRFTQARPGRDGKDGSRKFYALDEQPALPPVYYQALDPFPHKELNPFLEPLKPFGDALSPEAPDLDGVGVTELLEGVEQLVDRRLFEIVSKFFMPKLDGIEDDATRDQTGQEIVALITALMGGDQLSWHALKDRPSIPVDTTLWQDIFKLRTAYTAGHVVLVEGTGSEDDSVYIYTEDVPDTNTVQPADDPRAHAINIGAPDTVVSLTATATAYGIQLIATHRDGTKHTQDVYITQHFYTKEISDTRFAKAAHNHNMVYFTKDQVRELLRNYFNREQVNNLLDNYYRTTRVDALLNLKADASALNSKADADHNHNDLYYTKAISDTRYAKTNHNHNALYYTCLLYTSPSPRDS